MMRSIVGVVLSMLLLVGRGYSQENAEETSLHLTLPPECYAVVGVETSIYFDNVVLTQQVGDYRFAVTSPLGNLHDDRWTLTPGGGDVGTHELSIRVSDKNGRELASAKTKLHVTAADAGAGRELTLLIVGDSLTHATAYPNEIARLLARPSNPKWRMLGTHKPSSAQPGVAHEGYGGWTWQRFASKYEPNPDGTYRKRSSPFVYLGTDGKPQLDVARYLREECENNRPDIVVFMLGINDCFHAPPDDLKAVNAKIDTMFEHAERLLKSFREAAPEAEFAICLTTPPNSRDEAFEANYKGRYSRWGWKRIQHQVVRRQIDRFAEKDATKTFIVPTQLNLDPIAGYPTNNGVHPNTIGYQQIGRSIYAFLKSRMSERER